MRCFKFLGFIALAALTSCGSADADLYDFKPLVGTWVLDDPGRAYSESWVIDGDKVLGTATEVVDGDTAFSEDMTIFRRGEDGWVMGVRAQGQNEGTTVFFRLFKISFGYFKFENPSHDFPKRIIYEVVGTDRLKARVDNGEKGDRILTFDFVRAAD